MSLLFDEPPRLFSPTLARIFGVNEAMLLQQIHFWVGVNQKKKQNFWNGYHWTYNTHEQWQEEFPWLSVPTLRRAIKNLEEAGLLITRQVHSSNRTKWYRIDQASLIMAVNMDKNGNPM